MFQGKIKEAAITIPGMQNAISHLQIHPKSSHPVVAKRQPQHQHTDDRPGPLSSSKSQLSTSRPNLVEDRDIYASGALPPLSLVPSKTATATATGLPDEIPIPKFKTPSNLSYTSIYPEDEVDWSELTPPLPPSHLDSGPCRSFRDPQAAADEERARHFAQHRQQWLQKLVSDSDALRGARALPNATGAEAECDPLEALCKLDSTRHMVSGGFGSGTHMLAGEIGSVYIPGAWRSQSKGSAAEGDLFSDVVEGGGDTDGDDDDDDEEQWDAEFARAEEEDGNGNGNGNEGGGHSFSYENGGLSTWRTDRAAATPQGAGKDAASIPVPPAVAVAAVTPYVKHKQVATKNQQEGEDEARVPDRYGDSINEPIGKNVRGPQGATHVPTPASGAAAADPAAAPYVKHTSFTGTRDWAYPAPAAPSPTESQLLASGFEFHNELSEKEQIARFGDKAFRKALREVLPSLSRKQQWYAWQRVNEENYGEGTTSKGVLKEEANEGNGGCECRCPSNGEECDGDDGKCGKLLSECLCGDCKDCDEHYLWHYPGDACETEGGLGEPPESTLIQRFDSGKGREGGDEQTEWLGQDCKCSNKRDHVNRGAEREGDTFKSGCGCGGDGANCLCPLGRYACKDYWKSRAQHHRPVSNHEVSDRQSDGTSLISHGRLVDSKPMSQVRQGLDVGRDVPAAPVSRIPGLDLLDQASDVQPSYDQVRRSVEPEIPRRQMHRESTPAYENRSPSPSPIDRREDVEMIDASSTTTLPPLGPRLSLPQPPIPAPETTKTTKRGGRRKSAVQGSKVEKTSTTKGRAVSRTVTTAVKNAAENAGNMVKEAVARIEASVKAQDEDTPRRSARIRAMMQREATP